MSKQRFPVPPPVKRATPVEEFVPSPPGTVLGRVPKDAVAGKSGISQEELDAIKAASYQVGVGAKQIDVPVSPDIASQVQQVVEEAADYYGLSPLDPSTPPLDPPEPVPIESLTGAERQKAEQAFREMDELQDRMNRKRVAKKNKPPEVMRKPGAAAAIAVAEKAEAEFHAKYAPETGPQRPPFKVRSPEAEKVDPAPEPAPAQELGVADTGAALPEAHTHCPRCNFELASELTVPTIEDKINFLKAVLEGGRFAKRYELFGGRITVAFRSLKPREVDAAIRQADEEVKNGTVKHVLQYSRHVEGYKLAAGVFELNRNGEIFRLPELSNIEAEPGVEPIKAVYDYLNNDLFNTDSLRNAVGARWIEFTKLLQHLEAKAEDPDFFSVSG